MTSNVSSLSIRLLFKITDSASNFTFYMKHWKTSAVGIKLTLTINGNTANSLTKYVDAFEAEGGENNLLAIALRNQDISSVDYHDYLKLGLNAIDIAINPIEPISAGAAAVVYQIRAVSIEKE